MAAGKMLPAVSRPKRGTVRKARTAMIESAAVGFMTAGWMGRGQFPLARE
jgi:hypothetical protein